MGVTERIASRSRRRNEGQKEKKNGASDSVQITDSNQNQENILADILRSQERLYKLVETQNREIQRLKLAFNGGSNRMN